MLKVKEIVTVEVDVNEHLEHANTQKLIDELKKRDYTVIPKIKEEKGVYDLPEFSTSEELISFLKQAFGLKRWYDTKRLISEFNELVQA